MGSNRQISPDTSLRDITDLIGRRVLRREDAGGRSTGYMVNDAMGVD